jgi:hypothetical protein
MEDDLRHKRFLWGVVLAWSPWVPMMTGLSSLFRACGTRRQLAWWQWLGDLRKRMCWWASLLR